MNNVSGCPHPLKAYHSRFHTLHSLLTGPTRLHRPGTKRVMNVLCQRRHARVLRTKNKRYIARYLDMTVLPTLEEDLEEDLASTVTMTGCNPTLVRPDRPWSIPDTQWEASGQMERSTTIAETNRTLKAEEKQLSSVLQDAVSQCIVSANELQKMRREHAAVEKALRAP